MQRSFFILTCQWLSSPAVFAQSPARPNILFIYANDLGIGDTSAYGATSFILPNFEL